MKQTSLAMKVMMAVLVLGVTVYLGVYFFRAWSMELVTIPAYETTVDLGISAPAVIIRDETVVLGSGGGYVDLTPADGERVAYGDTVATLYADPSGLEKRKAIRLLTAEIDRLSYVLSSGSEDVDTAKLDAGVIQSMVELRTLSTEGDLSSLEDCALELRTVVFQRDYASGGQSAAAVSTFIQQKQQELSALQSSLSRVSTAVTAPVSGVFSSAADGLEERLTLSGAAALTPGELDGYLRGQLPGVNGAVGKLITSSTWYLAVLMDAGDVRGLSEGETYPINFSHDWFGTVEMTLEHISDKEDGQVVALFSARTRLSETALLRRQTVDVVTRQISGIRVPRQALRVQTTTGTDPETGASTEVRQTGVYTVVGTRAEFQKVNVLYTETDFYLVEPVDPDASKRLRAGDDVIVNTAGLFDGKVVR